MASRIWVDWVWICCSWTVPCDNIGCLVEREAVVFIVDVIIVKVVFEIGCIPAYENVSEVVWTGGTPEFWVQPVIDSVVVLVEWVGAISFLLYRSDADDDTPCVDVGGRRII